MSCLPRSSTFEYFEDPVTRRDKTFVRISGENLDHDYVEISDKETPLKKWYKSSFGKPMIMIRDQLKELHQGRMGGVYYLTDQRDKVYFTSMQGLIQKIKYYVDAVQVRSKKFHYVNLEHINGKEKYCFVDLDKKWKYVVKKKENAETDTRFGKVDSPNTIMDLLALDFTDNHISHFHGMDRECTLKPPFYF
jgi:hypothetical protein